jgi:hypothetical protein
MNDGKPAPTTSWEWSQDPYENMGSEANYQQALEIFIEFGDRHPQASTYHQLGRVAEDLREYGEARQNDQQVSRSKSTPGDRCIPSPHIPVGNRSPLIGENMVLRQNYQQVSCNQNRPQDRHSQAPSHITS